MVSLQSRRVSADDDIDPYLCRYDAPEIGDASASDLVSLKWHGFIPPKWIMHLFITLLYVPPNSMFELMEIKTMLTIAIMQPRNCPPGLQDSGLVLSFRGCPRERQHRG